VYILGINAYHGDAAAALVKDGELIGGRLQTVTRSANERFYDLIDRLQSHRSPDSFEYVLQRERAHRLYAARCDRLLS
jgi:predicted NodU family carbamoyl transferase